MSNNSLLHPSSNLRARRVSVGLNQASAETLQSRVLVRLGLVPTSAAARWAKSSQKTGTLVVDTSRFDECVLHAVGKRPVCILTTPDALDDPALMAQLVDPDDAAFRRVVVVMIVGERTPNELTAWDTIHPDASDAEVGSRLQVAFAAAQRRLDDWEEVDDYHRRRNLLSREESQVLESVCLGKLNKQIAAEVGISIRTVEQRRRRVFTKMGVESAIPLARKIGKVEALEGRSIRRDKPHSGGLSDWWNPAPSSRESSAHSQAPADNRGAE